MYIIIREDKAEHLKKKVHKLKEFATEIMECLEDAKEEAREREMYGRDDAMGGGRYDDEDYGRDMARGGSRGGRGGGRGRY